MIFSLAGFVQSPAVSAQQVREQKDELIRMIRELGGSVIEKDEWDPRVTHVVAHVDGKKESMSEKVMAALASFYVGCLCLCVSCMRTEGT